MVQNDFDRWWRGCRSRPTPTTVTWDGKDDAGRTACAHGRYGFTLESYAGEHAARHPAAAQVFARCRRCGIVDGAPVLVVEDGTQVPLDEVGGGAAERRAQPGSSSSLAALSIAASALEPPRSGCTRRISRR